MWPWFASIHFPPGFYHPTPARMVKTMAAASFGTIVLAAIQIVTIGGGLSAAGLLVSFLFIAAMVYLRLGWTFRA